ncbi:hypothetical protein [Mycolicibacterium sp.]|uniref:hypothetical protein n=1 Tax=Mycolicibacterium sp. TaxID=2320850 RepID=UPI003D11DF41
MTPTPSDMRDARPEQAWELNRRDAWDRPTSGTCHGYVQANLAILPRADALDFFRFCQATRNHARSSRSPTSVTPNRN